MQLIAKPIPLRKLSKMAGEFFGGLVKAVVDIEKEIMVVHADMHADEEKYLLEHGSKQDNLWGINLYPNEIGENFIEFDSMINLRPRLSNFSRGIENEEIRKKISTIVTKLITR